MLFSYLYFKIQHPLPRVQISSVFTRVVNDSGIGTRFRNQNRNQSLVCWNQNWNRNHMMLESKLDRNQGFWETLESQEVGATL